MTPDDWDAAMEPWVMLGYLRDAGRASQRKPLLFGVACCRRIWGLLEDPRSREAVEVMERFADGQASVVERSTARLEADDAAESSTGRAAFAAFGLASEGDDCYATAAVASRRAAEAAGSGLARELEKAAQC